MTDTETKLHVNLSTLSLFISLIIIIAYCCENSFHFFATRDVRISMVQRQCKPSGDQVSSTSVIHFSPVMSRAINISKNLAFVCVFVFVFVTLPC